MICATDERGATTYASPDWTVATGQPTSAALGFGWTSRIHPADTPIVLGVLRRAVEAQAAFGLWCRLCSPSDDYFWVVTGATPSFGITDEQFVGFVGAAALAHDQARRLQAYGTVARAVFPPLGAGMSAPSTPGLVANHLLTVHALLETDGNKALLQLVDLGLYLVGQDLPHDASIAPPAA